MSRFTRAALGFMLLILALFLIAPAVLAELRRAPACDTSFCPEAIVPAQTEEPTQPTPEPTATVTDETQPTPPATSETPPPTPAPVQTEEVSALWNGYTDKRLNPQQDEYYSVWCQNDQIEVWRGVPSSSLLGYIPIADALALDEGDTLTTDDDLTVTRSVDWLIVSGTNGNWNALGTKWFTVAECLRRNGGTPIPRTSTRPAPAPAETPEVG
jgi:hypothetical protein